MSEERQIINKVILKYGAIIDTLATAETYHNWKKLEPQDEVVIDGVFGDKIYTSAEYLLGFIDNESKDMGKVMEAAQNIQRAAGQMPGPRLVRG